MTFGSAFTRPVFLVPGLVLTVLLAALSVTLIAGTRRRQQGGNTS